MSQPSDGFRAPGAHPDEARRLTFDLDVDVCVIGAGLAGLTTALEAARMGADVALLEAHRVGGGASGHQLGMVMPGFGIPAGDLIARVGLDHARELWALSLNAADYIGTLATEKIMPGIARREGALEVSNVDVGDRLIGLLQTLGEDFGTDVEGWQVDQVRDVLRTQRYFHAIHYPQAFQIDGHRYLHGLARLAREEGVRIFEDTPVTALDGAGIRKRIATPRARMRAAHVVLAGNVSLGAPMPRLSDTLLPVWRHAALTVPLGERLADVIRFEGGVTDSDGIDQFRIVYGDRLMWASPETTWPARPERMAGAIRRRIRSVFPQLGNVELDETFGGAVGVTVHGMPQIGQLRPGVWVASGFGRQGLATSAIAGRLIATGIMRRDDRWQLFTPFELVWAGGISGRVAGQAVGLATRGGAAAAGMMARYRERARARERAGEARLAAANQRARTRAAQRTPPRQDI